MENCDRDGKVGPNGWGGCPGVKRGREIGGTHQVGEEDRDRLCVRQSIPPADLVGES
jgi:hypothetical protein